MSLHANGKDSAPKLSVLMCVYNGASYIGDAIESILNQTHPDFEFIIINDGSSDNTADIVESYASKDPRIVSVAQPNAGLTKALNRGIAMARGEYIARQDADDISYPGRFQKQLNVFKERPDVVLVGGCSDDVHDDGMKTVWTHYDEADLMRVVFYKTPFPHSTVMMKTKTCRELGSYDESFKTSQDMEFWMRFSKIGRLFMVEEPILLRRVSKNSISVKRKWRQFYDSLRARLMHAPNVTIALYHFVRSVVISILPPPVIQKIKGILS